MTHSPGEAQFEKEPSSLPEGAADFARFGNDCWASADSAHDRIFLLKRARKA